MRETLKRHTISFQYAWEGIVWAVRTQPNFRVHVLLAVLALGLGWFLNITTVEMTIIVFTIVLGLSCEMVNTSIEAMTDLITTEHRQNAKIAKDVAAGMMLITAIGAVGVALIIFVPHIVKLFS